MPRFHQAARALNKAASTSNAATGRTNDDDLALDYDLDPRNAATNVQTYTVYMDSLKSFAASTYPLADGILFLAPGTSLPDIPRPAAEADEINNAVAVKDWMSDRKKRKEQLKQLHGDIISSMTLPAKDVVSRDPLWLTHTLARADADTLHHLLKAIHLAYMTRSNVPPEQASVDALTSLLTAKQSDAETITEYKGSFNARVALAKSLGKKEFTAAELAVMFANGLHPKFDALKSELQKASSITNTYLKTVDEVVTALQRLDAATWSGGGISAFAVRAVRTGKNGADQGGDKDKDFIAKLKKNADDSKKEIEKLKGEITRLKSKKSDEGGDKGKGGGDGGGGAVKGGSDGKKSDVGSRTGSGAKPYKGGGQMSKAAGTSKKNQTIAGGTEFYDSDESDSEGGM